LRRLTSAIGYRDHSNTPEKNGRLITNQHLHPIIINEEFFRRKELVTLTTKL